MSSPLRRLVRTTAAYQAADVVAKVLALGLLPLYTRSLQPRDYGAAELLLTAIVAASIVLRLGVMEAFTRLWFLDDDPARRRRVGRTAWAYTLGASSAAALAGAALAGPLSEVLLGYRDVGLLLSAVLGLWAFSNLEVANAALRVRERVRAYLTAALLNVALTVALTVTLVVGLDAGAVGLVLGNFGASALVLVGLWWTQRADLVGAPTRGELRGLLGFGVPIVPAELSVYALNVVDRFYLVHARGLAQAGFYALAIKLAAVVSLLVRAFQYAWPPLAYSVRDDDEAARLYGDVIAWYVAVVGTLVAAVALLGRWVVRLLAAPDYFPAHRALPWVALGWALYGLVLVLASLAGRVRRTGRNAPAALLGLGVNVGALVVLVPALGLAGAGLALVLAYAVMLVAMWALTRRLFAVALDRGRLVRVVAVLAAATAAAELGLPTSGAGGLVGRTLVVAALPVALGLTGFAPAPERARVRALLARLRRPRVGARLARPGADPGAGG